MPPRKRPQQQQQQEEGGGGAAAAASAPTSTTTSTTSTTTTHTPNHGREEDEDPEILLDQGQIEAYKAAILKYAKHVNRGSLHFIEPVAVPPKASSGGRRGGGNTGSTDTRGFWDLRELCKKLAPLASWDDVAPHHRFKQLPSLNIDLLASADPQMREHAMETIVRLNQERLVPFFKTNPLTTSKKKKNYKPPQRHRKNETVMAEGDYRTPFLEFFKPGQKEPVGVTDVGQVVFGIEDEEEGGELPPGQKAEVEEALTHTSQFQGDRTNLRLFVELLEPQIHYPSLSRDIFVRMHDGQVARVYAGEASPSICYIDGVSGPLPTLYVERSGCVSTPSSSSSNRASSASSSQASATSSAAALPTAEQLWFTRTHNEFGCLSFLNLMCMAGEAHEDFFALLQKDAEGVMKARRDYEGFKLWIFVLNDNAENTRRADLYAQTVHQAQSWGHFVDWLEGGAREYRVRIKDLLDWGVDVAVTVQRVGELIVGGPGVSHGVAQHGASLAVAVNICHLDLLHLPVRMSLKGGDLAHRGNRKTVGAKPWYKITADSILSILRSLSNDLRKVLLSGQQQQQELAAAAGGGGGGGGGGEAPAEKGKEDEGKEEKQGGRPVRATRSSSDQKKEADAKGKGKGKGKATGKTQPRALSRANDSVERKRRLRRLEADMEQLGTSLRLVRESMKVQKPDSAYSKGLVKQGWEKVHDQDYMHLWEALQIALKGRPVEEVLSLLGESQPSLVAGGVGGGEEEEEEEIQEGGGGGGKVAVEAPVEAKEEKEGKEGKEEEEGQQEGQGGLDWASMEEDVEEEEEEEGGEEGEKEKGAVEEVNVKVNVDGHEGLSGDVGGGAVPVDEAMSESPKEGGELKEETREEAAQELENVVPVASVGEVGKSMKREAEEAAVAEEEPLLKKAKESNDDKMTDSVAAAAPSPTTSTSPSPSSSFDLPREAPVAAAAPMPMAVVEDKKGEGGGEKKGDKEVEGEGEEEGEEATVAKPQVMPLTSTSTSPSTEAQVQVQVQQEEEKLLHKGEAAQHAQTYEPAAAPNAPELGMDVAPGAAVVVGATEMGMEEQ